MSQRFEIQKGDWMNDEPVEVVVESWTEAVVNSIDGEELFELEIEWDDEIEGYKEWGVGYVDGRETAFVYQFDNSMDWYAREIDGDVERDDRNNPFVALAQIVFTLGW